MAPAAIVANGSTPLVTDLMRFSNDDPATIDLVLRQFRCLIADLCQQFNGGHPG